MLELTKGASVPKASMLSEQYDRSETLMTANIDSRRIKEVFQHFICMQENDLFFILELPVSSDVEAKLRKADTDPMHKDIYYMDFLSKEEALTILIRYGELLINDGISRFGYGVHDNNAEIMRDKYNVITLWSNCMEKYDGFFEEHGIPRVDKCFTAWDTFSSETPGTSSRIEIDGLSVYDLPEKLKEWGLYLYEQTED